MCARNMPRMASITLSVLPPSFTVSIIISFAVVLNSRDSLKSEAEDLHCCTHIVRACMPYVVEIVRIRESVCTQATQLLPLKMKMTSCGSTTARLERIVRRMF